MHKYVESKIYVFFSLLSHSFIVVMDSFDKHAHTKYELPYIKQCFLMHWTNVAKVYAMNVHMHVYGHNLF